jgi:hypothetical protein
MRMLSGMSTVGGNQVKSKAIKGKSSRVGL